MTVSRARARWGKPATLLTLFTVGRFTITVSRTVIIPRTEPTDEGCSAYFVKCSASSIASRAAKPGTLTLFTSKGPFHLKLDNLGLTVDDDGDLSPTETTDP